METPNAEVDALVRREYRHGFVTDLESDTVPPGLDEDVIRLISRKKREPEFLVEWRLKAYRHWLTMSEPGWANVTHASDRLRRDLVLLRPEIEGRRPEEPRRGRSEAPRDVREARNPARGARRARGRRGRRGLRQRLRRHHVQGQAGRAGHRLLLVLRGGARAPGARGAVPRHRGAVHRQLLRLAQLRGLQRRLVLLHPQGRALPDGAVHLLPDQRGQDRTVRTHPRHRGRGELRELPGGVHRPGARREPAPRRGGRARRTGRRGDQVLDGAELVSRATSTGSAASTTSSPSAATAGATGRRSPGPRSRPARPSPGSTRAASCAATTRWARSTPWRSATCASRRTPARR